MQKLESILRHNTRFAFDIDRFQDGKRLLVPLPGRGYRSPWPEINSLFERRFSGLYDLIQISQQFGMGSLDIKSDPKVLEPKHENGSNESESTVDSPTTSNKNDAKESMSASDSDYDKKVYPFASPSSSISSTDPTSEEPLQDSDSKHGGKVKEGIDYTSETPPIQVMERPTSQKYRIPSSVFARNQSFSQDWAMASNESLFSINLGSMNWKSEELDRYLEEVGTNPESDRSHKLGEAEDNHELREEGRTHKLCEEDNICSLGDISKIHGSSIPDEPVKLNLGDNQENIGRNSVVVNERISHYSAENGESGRSFTFPILTGDMEKGSSARISGSLEAIPEKETMEPEKQPKKDTPASTWTNCFGCCTFCS